MAKDKSAIVSKRGQATPRVAIPERRREPESDPVAEALGEQGAPIPMSEAILQVNPNHGMSAMLGDRFFTHNCQRCVWAVELAARGYDVEALPRTANSDYAKLNNHLYERSFLNVDSIDAYNMKSVGSMFEKATATGVKETILGSWPEGSRGLITVHRLNGTGHVLNWEIKNGKVTLYDGQTGKTPSISHFIQQGTYMFRMARLDNVDIKPLVADFVAKRGTVKYPKGTWETYNPPSILDKLKK